MRLRLVKEPFDHPDYLFELKHDGFRAVAYIENGEAWLVSRNLKNLRFDSRVRDEFLLVQQNLARVPKTLPGTGPQVPDSTDRLLDAHEVPESYVSGNLTVVIDRNQRYVLWRTPSRRRSSSWTGSTISGRAVGVEFVYLEKREWTDSVIPLWAARGAAVRTVMLRPSRRLPFKAPIA